MSALNNEDEDIRYYSLLYLAEEFGEEMNDELVEQFVNSDDLPTKMMVLRHLCNNNYIELNLLLKQQLELEEEMSLRVDIADSLLFRFGEPSDLKTVIGHQPNDPDKTARSLMAFSIDDFIPPKPDTLNWLELTTKLISYTDELYQYGWIQNEEIRDYYVQQLNAVNEALVNNEIEEACATINNQILPQSEQDLKEQLITTEGYKFLHYYTIYIKEEIESEFGSCLE